MISKLTLIALLIALNFQGVLQALDLQPSGFYRDEVAYDFFVQMAPECVAYQKNPDVAKDCLRHFAREAETASLQRPHLAYPQPLYRNPLKGI